MGATLTLLTVRDVARLLAVHEDTVRALIRRGELRVVRLGRAVRVEQEELDALKDRNRVALRADGPERRADVPLPRRVGDDAGRQPTDAVLPDEGRGPSRACRTGRQARPAARATPYDPWSLPPVVE